MFSVHSTHDASVTAQSKPDFERRSDKSGGAVLSEIFHHMNLKFCPAFIVICRSMNFTDDAGHE